MKKLKFCTDQELSDRNLGLQEIQRALNQAQVRFMLYDGVLLGAVREKNFIRWDWDVELALFTEQAVPKAKEVLQLLDAAGFEILNVNPDPQNFKINVNKYGTKYSMIGFYESGEVRRRKNWQYPKAFFDKTQWIEFLGSRYECPSPPESYLEFQYGDWKTPKQLVDQTEYLEQRIWVKAPSWKAWAEKGKLLFKKIEKLPSRFQKPAEREPLFLEMLKHSIQDGATLVEVGSSDAAETKFFLQSPYKNLRAIIVEPDSRSRERIQTTLQSLKGKEIKVLPYAVADQDRDGEFFLNPEKPHLNTAFAKDEKAKSMKVEYRSLSTVLKENQVKTPLIIKMDIEGFEVEALEGAKDFLRENKEVSILMELHPWAYNENHSLEKKLRQLVSWGYRFKYIESAAVPVPSQFRAMGLKPEKVVGYRALYRDVDADQALELACHKHFDLIDRAPGFTNKIVRSLLIER